MGIYCCKDKELENNDIILPRSIYKTKPPCCFDYYCPCSCIQVENVFLIIKVYILLNKFNMNIKPFIDITN